MNKNLRNKAKKLCGSEDGVTAVLMALMLTAFIGFAGFSVEAGHAYYAYQQLVTSTNAAALAAAQALPNVTTASANATTYSAKAGQMNASGLLTNVTVTPTPVCSSALAATSSLGISCLTSTDGNAYNAVKVTQTADATSWFGKMFGVNTFHMSYTAAAAMSGGANTPWNIAIVLDATPSMAFNDNGLQCSGTQESCALKGIQALLTDLYPCQLGVTCTSSSTYVDAVALYVFPSFTTATYKDAYCDSGSNPKNTVDGYYVVPTLTSSYTNSIIPFSNDYKTTDTASSLNTSSNMVKATGYAGTGCIGVYPPSGNYTYYAQAIYTAQADLAAWQKAHPGSKNAMIILSDGNATEDMKLKYTQTCTTKYGGQTCTNTGLATTSGFQPSTTSPYSLNGVSFNNPNSYTYPSAIGECGQGVEAAKKAADAGTEVYTIGYGADTSGCTSDKNYSISLTTGGGSWRAGYSPCKALAAMASSTANFYSDNANGCKATDTTNQNFTKLTQIFTRITQTLTTPRLVSSDML